jgi:4-hydroxy-tetrahydrodipicolinate synthase
VAVGPLPEETLLMTSADTLPAPSGDATTVTGLVPPIATPFLDGRVDYDSLKRQLDHLVGHVHGILLGGSCAENPSLTLEERIEIGRVATEHLPDDVAVAFSISDNSMANCRRLADAAGDIGADLLMLVCPTYFPNDLAMLEEYFGTISSFAPTDICLYDNPYVSKTILSVADIRALVSAAPRITHLKATDTTLYKVHALSEQTDLTIHAGDDNVLWHQLTGGAKGAMVSMPMIYPERTATFWRLFTDGALQDAYAEYRQMTHFIHCSLNAPDYPGVIKAVLHHHDIITSPEVRPPFPQLTTQRRTEIIASL